MKKIDLHIHTVSTDSDRQFVFSMKKLKEYVSHYELDAIAITNHNMFDLVQFDQITNNIEISVFAGIEVDIEGGQILLISDGVNLNDFNAKCELITAACPNKKDSITTEKLTSVFGDLSKYILIPHYDKKPSIKEETLSKLALHITAGEVSSPKKFKLSEKP